jgi:hypothetical protein
LNHIPFPGLPKLLLPATHLATLYLWNIPHSGYISPKAMTTVLSALTHLDNLTLQFQSPLSRPDSASRLLPPPTRSVLFVLTDFSFKGDNEYLDDLVAHIDAPRLNQLHITFFNDILFDIPQLMRFICRAPTLKALKKACVTFGGDFTTVEIFSPIYHNSSLSVKISCRELDWQVSLMHQVFTSSLPPLSTLEDLCIVEEPYWAAHSPDNIENLPWLELLLPFRTVTNLYLTKKFEPLVVRALKELIGSRATEVLPTLRYIFLQEFELSGPVQEGIQQFVATRQVIGDRIIVLPWGGEWRSIGTSVF